MSDDDNHIEPTPPPADDLADRLFLLGIGGILGFISIVFIFIL
jgi:hypothetical protein